MEEHEDAHDIVMAVALATQLNLKALPRRTKVAGTYGDYRWFAKEIVEHLKRSGWRFEKQVRPESDFTPPTPGWTPPS